MTAELFAYCDRLAVEPGGQTGVHVGRPGGPGGSAEVTLCRAGWREVDGKVATVLTPVPGAEPVTVAVDPAPVRSGSYLSAAGLRLPVTWRPADGVALGLLAAPLTTRGERQVLAQLTLGAHRLVLAVRDTELTAESGGAVVALRVPRLAGNWWAVAASVGGDGQLTLAVLDVRRGVADRATTAAVALSTGGAAADLLLAASGTDAEPAALFTGKLESPVLAAADAAAVAAALAGSGAVPGELARWDFAQDMVAQRLSGTGPAAVDAVLVNAPSRAVTGSRWDATVQDWRQDPARYAAIHFHDTDLDDARWARAACLPVPDGLPGGFYAVRVRDADGGEDHVPLVVRERDPDAEVLFLASTFTYLAYGNNSLFLTQHFDEGVVVGRSARDAQLGRNPVFGRSVYDRHSDGSGVQFSSFRRPILNFRFDHRSSVQDAPRNLGADLFVAEWLRRTGVDHDLLTDHDLHFAGAVPAAARVLVTGTHPEYFSAEMLDAVEAFLRRGGSLMYLGGNGFYWATSAHPDAPHRIELRRSHGGTRGWDSAPGEDHHAAGGQPGGLWRHLGRSTHALTGVGMAGQGWDERAPGYRRAPEATGPLAERLLAGIGPDERVGEFGYAMGGAAGDEIDRMDHRLGTPVDAVRLLTSTGHSALYKLATEEVGLLSEPQDGTTTDAVRSDVCVLPTGFGGHVFSVGSITWAASMAWNDYANNVELVTRNALDLLLER